MRVREVESLEEFDEVVASGEAARVALRVQSVDLRGRTRELLALDPRELVLLGCRLERTAERHVRQGGGLVFPHVPDVPFNPYRSTLYSAEELYADLDAGYPATPDARVYAWSRAEDARTDLLATELAAIHDDAMGDALDEALVGRRVVGVMGGHAVRRDVPDYLRAAVLGRALARAGLLVVTGGGPGAMEAVNLGAYLAPYDDAALPEAVDLLAEVPDYDGSVTDWASAAFAVRRRFPAREDGASVGIPTWYYGHEPPNVFAALIAKYFANALREDVLLARARAGVVFLPGAAGTVQEIFQAATRAFYADGEAAPLVLVGGEQWTTGLPVWPLVRALGTSTALGRCASLVDGVDGDDGVETVLRLLAPRAAGHEPKATPSSGTG